MSLELISGVDKSISSKTINVIVENICNNGYENVYFLEDYKSHGFVQIGHVYVQNTPPLFDLFIQDFYVSLSVYGDLKDLEKICKVVTDSFGKNNIQLQLKEEGEDD